MHIEMTAPAKAWIEKKCAFYIGRKRLPRILLAAQTCHGAEFRLHFDSPRDTDLQSKAEGITFIMESELLDKYGGFTLDLESFFFTNRLLIKPLNEIKQCDCGKTHPCGE